jgi:hypothetical protein
MASTNPGARTCSSTASAAAQPGAWFSNVWPWTKSTLRSANVDAMRPLIPTIAIGQ